VGGGGGGPLRTQVRSSRDSISTGTLRGKPYHPACSRQYNTRHGTRTSAHIALAAPPPPPPFGCTRTKWWDDAAAEPHCLCWALWDHAKGGQHLGGEAASSAQHGPPARVQRVRVSAQVRVHGHAVNGQSGVEGVCLATPWQSKSPTNQHLSPTPFPPNWHTKITRTWHE
jgi:hypothetical protein